MGGVDLLVDGLGVDDFAAIAMGVAAAAHVLRQRVQKRRAGVQRAGVQRQRQQRAPLPVAGPVDRIEGRAPCVAGAIGQIVQAGKILQRAGVNLAAHADALGGNGFHGGFPSLSYC